MAKNNKNVKKYSKPFGLIVGLLLIILLFLVVFLTIDRQKTYLSVDIPKNLVNKSNLDVILTAYSAESPTGELYRSNGIGLVDSSQLAYSWEIPSEYKNRDTYVELAVKDDSSSDTYTTCTYYVANNSKGLMAGLFGWNKLDEGQKIGCGNEKQPSFISLKKEVEKDIDDISLNGLKDNSLEIEKLAKELAENNKTIVNNYYSIGGATQQGAAGSNGANGKDGRDGIDGKNGKDGENSGVGSIGPAGPQGERGEAGVQGEKGEKGDKGDAGRDGVDGNDGADGQNGLNGRDGVDGTNGNDGRDGVDGAKGQDGANGSNGINGVDGKSAYQIWLVLGNEGTEADFIASLKGAPGDDSNASFELLITGGGLIYDSNTLSLEPCSAGQILKVNSSGIYTCANDNDNDTKYSAGQGLYLDASNVFRINSQDCTAEGGNKLTFDSTKGGFVCSADVTGSDNQALSWNAATKTLSIDRANSVIITDNDTKYSADNSKGISLNGTEFGLISCNDNQVLRFSAQAGQTGGWLCSDESANADLSGYLQIANLESAIANLSTPGYYNKSEINALINTIPSGGLLIPVSIANESNLPTDVSSLPAGYHWYIQDMDITQTGHTGRAWVYEDSNGNKSIYKTIDNYLSPDSTSIIVNGSGNLTVSTTWLASVLNGYVKQSDIPTCATGKYLKWNATSFTCEDDKDSKYKAGLGLLLDQTTNTFSIDSSTCDGNSNKLIFNATTGFSCGVDNVATDGSIQTLTYSSGSGELAISGGNTVQLTKYQAGDGLKLNGSTFGVNIPSACTSTQKLTWDGANFVCTEDMTVPPEICYNIGDTQYINRSDDKFTDAFSGELWYRLNGQLIGADVLENANTAVISKTTKTHIYPQPFVLDDNFASAGYNLSIKVNTRESRYNPIKVFDGISGNVDQNGYFAENAGSSWWLQIQFPSPRKLESYQLIGAYYSNVYSFDDWQIQGSNNGSTWEVLDTGNELVRSGRNITRSTIKNVSNPGEYSYYRLQVGNSTNHAALGEWAMNFPQSESVNPYGYSLPNQPRNADGHYPYIKISGECYNSKEYELKEGTTNGYVLSWDGNDWVESGAINIDSLTANTITGNMFNIKKITDSKGSVGQPGQVLTIDTNGEVVWQ